MPTNYKRMFSFNEGLLYVYNTGAMQTLLLEDSGFGSRLNNEPGADSEGALWVRSNVHSF